MDDDDYIPSPYIHLICAGSRLAEFAIEIAQEMEEASGDVMDGAECRALVAAWNAALQASIEAAGDARRRLILESQRQPTPTETTP